MGDRMKRLVSWLLAMFLVASVVTGCQAGSPSGEGWQDRAAIQQQDTAVQEAAQGGPQESTSEETQGGQQESTSEETQGGPQERLSEETQGGPQESLSEETQGGPQESTLEETQDSRRESPSEVVQGERQSQLSEEIQKGPEEKPLEEPPGQLQERPRQAAETDDTSQIDVEEDGVYTSKEEVAAYIHLYGHLPDNYITKKEAEELGWDSRQGNLAEVAPGKSIGGSRFGNYEGLLPEKEGRHYRECDIGYEGGRRGAERLVYSDDGLIFYTEDHYKTFEQLYETQGDGS